MWVDFGTVYKMLHFTRDSICGRKKMTAANKCNAAQLGVLFIRNFKIFFFMKDIQNDGEDISKCQQLHCIYFYNI